jgi:methylated-DNA-protein-cysteine methyltransferase-like protein
VEPFTVRAVAILKAVPAGKVVTYGQVAAMAGDPRAARQVVRILVTMSEAAELPWHRVVNAKGQVSLPGAVGREQRRKLEAEGVELDEFGATSLARYQWRGPTTRPHDNT